MFHRYFLFGEQMNFAGNISKTAPGSPPLKFGWFVLVSSALIFLPIAIAVVVVIKIAPDLKNHNALIGYLLIIALPLYLIALSAFGTVLPALVERNRAYKVSSALRATFRTMWRLLLGPALVGAVILAALIFLNNWLATNPTYQSAAGQFVAGVLARTLGFLPTVLAVAVLCQVYQMIRPATAPTENAPEEIGQNA